MKIEFDEETKRLIKLGCKKLNMTPEQLVEEATKHLAKVYNVKIQWWSRRCIINRSEFYFDILKVGIPSFI